MSSVIPHKGKWRAQLYVLGRRESRVFRTRREAKAWALARENELRSEAEKPVAERVTLHELLRRYVVEVSPTKRGAEKEEFRLRAMMKMLPDVSLARVTPEVIQTYRDTRLAVVKPNSVLRELGSLSAVFEHAIREWRWVASNPVRLIRKPPRGEHRTKTWTASEIRKLLGVMGYSPRGAGNSIAVCFLVALRTGMRAGELCGLTWDRVSENSCRVSGKTQAAAREVPVGGKTRRLLEKMRGKRKEGSDLVFGLKVDVLGAAFRKFREQAGISGLTFHDARHTAATWLVRDSRLNAFELCRIMGWTDPKMAMVYYQPAVGDLVKRLGGRR